jgi:hypothetical protein
MRYILIAAGLAASALVTSPAVQAQTFQPNGSAFEPGAVYQAGGPDRVGNMCKVMTDDQPGDEAYGYYEPCASQALASAPQPQPRRVHALRGRR